MIEQAKTIASFDPLKQKNPGPAGGMVPSMGDVGRASDPSRDRGCFPLIFSHDPIISELCRGVNV